MLSIPKGYKPDTKLNIKNRSLDICPKCSSQLKLITSGQAKNRVVMKNNEPKIERIAYLAPACWKCFTMYS